MLDAVLRLSPADPAELRATAEKILKIRNEKYPPTMKCAGSIFKNLLLNELPAGVTVPEKVVREGKVPAAYFLELAGAKGLAIGGLRVADYHANLIYNEGGGTARDLWHLIETLKAGVFREVWCAPGRRGPGAVETPGLIAPCGRGSAVTWRTSPACRVDTRVDAWPNT